MLIENSKKDVRKIDGVQVIHDYMNCSKIDDCSKCACSKSIDMKDFINMCVFLRTFTASARDKIDKALNEVL